MKYFFSFVAALFLFLMMAESQNLAVLSTSIPSATPSTTTALTPKTTELPKTSTTQSVPKPTSSTQGLKPTTSVTDNGASSIVPWMSGFLSMIVWFLFIN